MNTCWYCGESEHKGECDPDKVSSYKIRLAVIGGKISGWHCARSRERYTKMQEERARNEKIERNDKP